MTKLSKRLLAIASLVRSDAKVVDVGCDHALLDIYLAYHHPKIKTIAVDNKRGSLKKSKLNINQFKMTNIVDLRLSDGLSGVKANEIDTIIIAGMGSSNIIEILTEDKSKLENVTDVIVQSTNDYYCLRKTICTLGYYIANEQVVKEKGICYLIVHFQKGSKKYNHKDYLFGPILRLNKDALYSELVNDEIRKKEILLSQIPQKYFLRRQKVKLNILKFKREIRRRNWVRYC